MVLDQLLSSMSVATFAEEYLFRLPFVCASGAMKFASLATLETVQGLLQCPSADTVVAKNGGWSNGLPHGAPTIVELLADGNTVGVRHAQLHDAGLKQLADDFGDEFLADVDVHVYCTPRNAPGFGWHYDAEDVFILQTAGSKEWSLRKNTVNPWPIMETLPTDMHYEREIMPLQKCLLSKGDWLYIPNGYWHTTRAIEESISLSVGIRALTGLDVLDYLRDVARDSLLWRARLALLRWPDSAASSGNKFNEQIHRLSDDLTQRLNDQQFRAAFVKRLRRRCESISNADPN